MYSFAVQPDIAFFFQVPLKTALNRILSGRPQLKYHEAGMDLNLSDDPYESFALFQERINNEYVNMVDEFGFSSRGRNPAHRRTAGTGEENRQ